MKIPKIFLLILAVIICLNLDYFYNEDSILKRGKVSFYQITNFKEKIEYEAKFDYEFHISMKISEQENDYYIPKNNGYRYGPSIIYNEDGSLDAYFASPGNNSTEWDYITYAHFDGEKWSSEKVVLKPTKNSDDHYSVCDPAVIYFNNYYYLAYTSTLNSKGMANSLYVARSKNPEGPFEKWSGDSWGNNPKPIIKYEGSESYWGIGEASFVVVKDTLYCYYTCDNQRGNHTCLAISNLSEDWPMNLTFQGECITKNSGQDSSDVIYLEDYDLFVAVNVINRFGKDSGVVLYESIDGFTFEQTDIVKENMARFAHNMGISKRLDGHVLKKDEVYIGYAYATNETAWGRWATRFNKVDLEFYEGKISLPSSKKVNKLVKF